MRRARSAFIRKEIREILRDRRAILLSFVLPIFIYPVTFSFTSWLERRGESKAEEVISRIVVTGDAPLLRRAIEDASELVLVERDPDTDLRTALEAGEVDAWVDVGPPRPKVPPLPDEGDAAPSLRAPADEDAAPEVDSVLSRVRIIHHGPHEESTEARDRMEVLLQEVRAEESRRRFLAAGGAGDPEALVRIGEVDIATEAEAGGARAGRLIPFLLVMTLFIGGGAISTDLVAGEKERGTLETLYLAPVPRSDIAQSKFFVVWAACVLTGVLNLLSMLYCYRAGLISDATGGSAAVVISGPGVLLAFLLIVPLAALVGGLLLGISAMARSLREAQMYLAPVMLLAMIPGLLATGQHIPLSPFTALIPLANVALAIRDGLLGPVPLHLFAIVCGASVGWGLLATGWTTRILSREDTILGFDPEPFLARSEGGRRRAAMLGMAGVVLAYFYQGNLLQAWDLVPGLALSLWVLLPLLGAGCLALAWNGGTLRGLLSLRWPRPGAALGGALIGVGLVVPIRFGLFEFQQRFLPTPDGLTDGMVTGLEDLSMGAVLLLFAVSPAIWEELVFRGAFLGLWRRVAGARAAVLVSAAFFAVIHLSVFRLAPTFVIGAAAGLLVVRTGSIVPGMLLHAFYNGTAVLQDELPASLEWMFSGGPASFAAAFVLLGAGAWLALRPATGERDEGTPSPVRSMPPGPPTL
jgi:sodium transport system permease protein